MPAKERGHNLWYISPFRNENEPSLKVNRKINQWHDFGSGEKGNIIDLAMKLHNTNSVSEALQAIERAVPILPSASFSFRQQNALERIENITLKPLAHPALIQLLHKRKIPTDLAQSYCKEAHYTLSGKYYFAIAFPNDKGGYETLNPYFKGCIYSGFRLRGAYKTDLDTPGEFYSDFSFIITRQSSFRCRLFLRKIKADGCRFLHCSLT
ncbi:MAG: CHC2 zinc finger domain-containing protein [Proteiniphilum sp.]|nr:CHC2 zinc finger domain-containing protein [Proteiniphilum sp.]MDD3908367.1 CHC2 zinc finger domain-containing protein [Proteiniphilum sp.]MDD4415794.1 CHC2 zinc finger domain-containing protein [Proteiniphilum sp.]